MSLPWRPVTSTGGVTRWVEVCDVPAVAPYYLDRRRAGPGACHDIDALTSQHITSPTSITA